MEQIISIKKMRENNDPDVFINQVLNDPARLERVRQKQIEARTRAKREAEEAERKAKAHEEFQTFTLKLSVSFAACMTVLATIVALVH